MMPKEKKEKIGHSEGFKMESKSKQRHQIEERNASDRSPFSAGH